MSIKEKIGLVVSNRMRKTIIVSVETRTTHRKYGKVIAKTKRYTAHDENQECQIGDLVTILETRPISKTKHWILEFIKQRRYLKDTDIPNIGE